MVTELTICMPVYNGEKYLRQCVESVLNQSLRDFVFLIYDDGSTDNTVEIIESFHDDRIHLIQGGENHGGIWARTQLIRAIDTKYNMWIDSDDFFCNANAFKFALETIKSNDFDYVNFVRWKSVFKDGLTVNQSNYWNNEEFVYFGNNLFKERFLVENCYPFWSKIFKTELLKKCIPEDELLMVRTFSDDIMFTFMAFFCLKGIIINSMDILRCTLIVKV